MPLIPDSSVTNHFGHWDFVTKRPIVDRKIEDPITGQVREAAGGVYRGPPWVDVTIFNLHIETEGTWRFQRDLPMEKILAGIMRVVDEKNIELHSVSCTQYGIAIMVADDLGAMGGFKGLMRAVHESLEVHHADFPSASQCSLPEKAPEK